MEQNEQARLSALSNASMLSAIGVTLMYGLSLLLALLAPASVAVGVVSLIGLILWLIHRVHSRVSMPPLPHLSNACSRLNWL